MEPTSWENCETLMDGFEIEFAIAFGLIGKNQNEKGKTGFDWVLTKTTPMLGAELEMLCIHEHQKKTIKKRE